MLFNTACYTFVPVVAGASPAFGAQVRVQLTPEGAQQLAPNLGPGAVAAIGLLSERQPDGSVVVGVDQVERLGGARQSWAGVNVVTFHPRHVMSVDARTLNKSKTRSAVIGGVLGVLGVFALALGMGGVSGQAEGPGTLQPP
ncbi:MAG: hypothetical protein FJ202_07140 [Gemmatimonadetes bacterium]|nr:hypothetical protein [Gemmatimonadota bacterium]